MSSSNGCFLTCIQISQEAGQVVWYSHLFQNFPQFIVIHTVKGFGVANKAEVDVILELSHFFNDLADVGNLISGSSAFSKTQAGIKISGRNINNLRYADDTTLMAESEEELKSLLMKVKEESERVGLKPEFIFLGSKITADAYWSHEIKRCLPLGRKAVTNLDSILKSRDNILPTKVHLIKAIVFPVVMYVCESWTIKKAEHQRIDPLNCGIGEACSESLGQWEDQKEISPEYSL